MLLFHDLNEIRCFHLELGEDKNSEPTMEELDLFLKKRNNIIPDLKDFRRSQAARMGWRRHKSNYSLGISRFHRSTKGKKLHRALSRFLTTRDVLSPSYLGNSYKDKQESIEFQMALTSVATHLLIEQKFYMGAETQVSLELLTEFYLDSVHEACRLVIYDKPIGAEFTEILFNLIHPNELANIPPLSIDTEFSEWYANIH